MRHLAHGIWVFAYSFIPKYFTKVEPGWLSSRSTWKLCEFTQTHKAVALITFCGLFGDRSTVKILTMPQQFISRTQYRKTGCALWVGGTISSFFLAYQTDAGQSRASVSWCMWKRVDSVFLCVSVKLHWNAVWAAVWTDADVGFLCLRGSMFFHSHLG